MEKPSAEMTVTTTRSSDNSVNVVWLPTTRRTMVSRKERMETVVFRWQWSTVVDCGGEPEGFS
jgi:hypothetical protein